MFSSCATQSKRAETFNYSSDRNLEYTDALVLSKGRVYVEYGSMLAGHYPSDKEKSDIAYIESLLRAKGFTPTKSKDSADYAFSVKTRGRTWGGCSGRLARYIRSSREIIKYNGFTEVPMWSGDVDLFLDETTDPNIYKRQAFRRLVSMLPSRTERAEAPITEL